MEEYSENEFRRTEGLAGVGMIVTLILWVLDAFGGLSVIFSIFAWLSFGFFAVTYFRFLHWVRELIQIKEDARPRKYICERRKREGEIVNTKEKMHKVSQST